MSNININKDVQYGLVSFPDTIMVKYEDASPTGYKYICEAHTRVELTDANWKITRIKKDGTEIKYAVCAGLPKNAPVQYDQVATDLATVEALNYQ